MKRREFLSSTAASIVAAPAVYAGLRSAEPPPPLASHSAPALRGKHPRAWSTAEIQAILACARDDRWRPSGWSFTIDREPRKWWTALVLVSWDTGIGFHSLFQVACADVQVWRKTLILRAAISKSGMAEQYLLSDAAISALDDGMLAGSCELFPWSGERRTFFRHFRKLVRVSRKFYLPGKEVR